MTTVSKLLIIGSQNLKFKKDYFPNQSIYLYCLQDAVIGLLLRYNLHIMKVTKFKHIQSNYMYINIITCNIVS